jgi:hypothetical protein
MGGHDGGDNDSGGERQLRLDTTEALAGEIVPEMAE